MEYKQIIKNNYVLTPIKNAFNDKIAYWISKKNYTISLYCFTCYDKKDVENQIKNINSYIEMFEKFIIK